MIVLDSGDKIQGDAAAATVVDYSIYGLDNNALKQMADGQLAAATGDLYTADSVDVASTIILVNTDSVARTVNLYMTPSAGTARRIIPEDMSLGAGYSLNWSGDKMTVLNTSGQIISSTTLPTHRDTHDPNDGSDPLDTAAAAEIASVQVAAEGTSHSLARADHAHAINHGITDNHIVTVDGTPVDGEATVWTANGLNSLSEAEFKAAFNMEAGTDYLAQQTIGIANDNLLEVDGTPNSGEFSVFTANGIDGKTLAETKTLLGIDYKTLYIDAGAMVPCTTSPAEATTNEYVTNDIDMDLLAFDAGATEERAQFKLVMPEDWDRSTVKVKFYWGNAAGATASDTVEWGIKAGALSNDDAIDAALGTAVTVSDAVTADGDLMISDATGALTVGGTPALGDLVEFEVYRNTDGTDDMAEDAWLFGILIQYGVDQAVSAW